METKEEIKMRNKNLLIHDLNNSFEVSFKAKRLINQMDIFGDGPVRRKEPETQQQLDQKPFTSTDKAMILFIKHLYQDKKFDHFFTALRSSAASQRQYISSFIKRTFKLNARQTRRLPGMVRNLYSIFGNKRKFDKLQKIALSNDCII